MISTYIRFMYAWQLENWPDFFFDLPNLIGDLEAIQAALGKLMDQINHLPHDDRRKYLVEVLIDEALNTSSIEGEFFSRSDLRSPYSLNLN